MKNWLLCTLVFTLGVAKAQLPETRIYTLDINRSKDLLVFTNPQLISNNKGYNNQPYFAPDGDYIFYASNNGHGNTDIYRYRMAKKSPLIFWQKQNKRLTKTPEAEYSPRMKPDGTEINCVRVEKDTVTQWLYGYNTEGKKPRVYLPDIKNLGYYTWYGGIEIIGFTLPEPFLLSKFNVNTLRQDTIASNPGRTFQIHRNKIYYVDKATVNADSAYAIRMVSTDNLKLRYKDRPKVENPIVTFTLPKQEDFAIMNDGTFLMGQEGMLYAYKPSTKAKHTSEQKKWRMLADLKTLGIPSFYRLALSPDNMKIAVVSYANQKP